MVRLLLALVVAFTLSLSEGRPTAAQTPPVVDQRGAFLSAQDATGQIWGSVNDALNPLNRWQDGHWQTVPLEPLEWADILAMTRTSDGAVLCLWRKGATFLITRHFGGISRVLSQNQGGIATSYLFPDSQGGAWMLGEDDAIRHVTRDGVVRTSRIVPPSWYDTIPGHVRTDADGYDPLYAAEDGQKRLWVWADDLAGYHNASCLRGVLIWDGHTWSHHPTLGGVPDKPFSVIVPKDATHLWVAVADNGLYLVDTQTLRGTRVPAPEPGAFKGVERIFRDDQDWYVLDWVGTGGADRWVNAWRLRQGRWQEVIHGIDKGAEYEGQPRRAWISSPPGVWLAAFGAGAYFIPHGNAAAWPIDWRSGFPLTDVRAVYPLPAGKLLAVGGVRSVVLSSVPHPAAVDPTALRIVPMDTDCRVLVLDDQRHVWGLPALNHRDTLGEWDGRQWLFHAIPKLVRRQSIGVIATDNRRRVWLWAEDQTGSVFVFDRVSQRWTIYASFHAAIQGQMGLPNLRLSGFDVPRFRADGRWACYSTHSGLVAAFDGQDWHRWTPREVTSGMPTLYRPFFDQDGNLCVNSAGEHRSWQWTSALGWRSRDYAPGPDDPNDSHPLYETLRDIVPTADPSDTIAQDDQGAFWFVQNRRLSKAIFGLSASRLSGSSRQPFVDGRYLDDVTHDCDDGTWILTNNDLCSEYVYLPPLQTAGTQISLSHGRLGSIDLHFATSGQKKHLYVWRLDGKEWSKPQQASTAHCYFLPNGPHRVEVLALDAGLDTSLLPARLTFEVHVDAAQQRTFLIATLRDGSDDAREVAVAALRNQPDFGLPALRAARVTANDDSRWWIDAAIQQAEENMPPPAGQIPSP